MKRSTHNPPPSTEAETEQLIIEVQAELSPGTGVYELASEALDELRQGLRHKITREQEEQKRLTTADYLSAKPAEGEFDITTAPDPQVDRDMRARFLRELRGQVKDDPTYADDNAAADVEPIPLTTRKASASVDDSNEESTVQMSAVVEHDRPDLLGKKFGHYTLLRRINSGGAAEVHEATIEEPPGHRRRVAIKRLLVDLRGDEDFVTMFIDEAKISSQLDHPAIAKQYEFGVVEDEYFLSMEYVDGHDLDTIGSDSRLANVPIPVAVAVYAVQQALDGLDYAHHKLDRRGKPLGIVHRDISPANVICSWAGEVKIIDFGIAKAVSKLSKTRPGLVRGKLSYMSPEHMRGKPIDFRTDIYAAAVVLWELLAGQRLFVGNSDIETIQNVLNSRITDILELRPEVPDAIAEVLHRALSAKVKKRPARAAEMSTILQNTIKLAGHPDPRAELVRYLACLYAT